jgi:hypothetical protein
MYKLSYYAFSSKFRHNIFLSLLGLRLTDKLMMSYVLWVYVCLSVSKLVYVERKYTYSSSSLLLCQRTNIKEVNSYLLDSHDFACHFQSHFPLKSKTKQTMTVRIEQVHLTVDVKIHMIKIMFGEVLFSNKSYWLQK